MFWDVALVDALERACSAGINDMLTGILMGIKAMHVR
jgi:hypothetical protein